MQNGERTLIAAVLGHLEGSSALTPALPVPCTAKSNFEHFSFASNPNLGFFISLGEGW